MDRFIASAATYNHIGVDCLKSNMDRFIDFCPQWLCET